MKGKQFDPEQPFSRSGDLSQMMMNYVKVQRRNNEFENEIEF